MSYAPLSSVWEGRDGPLLARMIDFYGAGAPLVDATCNTGRIWRGSGVDGVVMLDQDPAVRPAVVADNRALPFLDGSIGTLIYDSPHLVNHSGGVKDFTGRYGAGTKAGADQGWSPAHLFSPFLRAASRALQPDGLLFAKLADTVHNHRSRWNHIDYIDSAVGAGFTVCDLIVKVRRSAIVSGKWRRAHHARKHHCFWIVCRNGESCE